MQQPEISIHPLIGRLRYEFSDLTVLRIEQGTRFVPDYEVVALAEFFHVSCEYLLGIKNEK